MSSSHSKFYNASFNNAARDGKATKPMDPYEILGISFPATDAAISKAYKKLALKLHPDKQQQQSQEQEELIAQRFHDIQEARSFLLDPEHSHARQQYDAQRESERIRKQTDALREQSMSERRKKLRAELHAKEKIASITTKATATRMTTTTTTTTTSSSAPNDQQHQPQHQFMEELRREGKRKRTELAEREAMKQQQQQQYDIHNKLSKTKREKEKKNDPKKELDDQDSIEFQQRQVRLKWDRKKLTFPSPTENSLAELLSGQFGTVDHVEILGKKGNQALVTFQNSSSCQPCVDFYANSKEMRAKYNYVKIPKREEIKAETKDYLQTESSWTEYNNNNDDKTKNKKQITRNDETLQDRKLRQAEERERLLWEMEKEGDDYETTTSAAIAARSFNTSSSYGGVSKPNSHSLTNKTKATHANHRKSKFPLVFHNNNSMNLSSALSPLQILEQFEDVVLSGVISKQDLESIKVVALPIKDVVKE